VATSTGSEIYVSAAALVVALIKNGYLDEAEEFIEWYLDTFDTDLSHLLPGE
jgi:hypothetical protein